ncbi:MAG: DUF1858 domain-containing protein [Clostridia bacterium]|nr:DUF1858 domain-containing protein [Clostridia bacterium]
MNNENDKLNEKESVLVTRETVISDLLEINPRCGRFLLEIGMHCLSCPMSLGETLEEACEVHGVDPDELIAEINDFLVNGSDEPDDAGLL